ncbi:methylmalonyl-CoA decarboxylase [Desulforhopalus vacuolatus]|uniref:methylmalonyl-CoA decarboxylase n=1 Tax=Desulforhopalus vacuolatus TaxID=40414 RepID=UPI00196574E5|nr:methylmalonyl-CoA decarboxylase [Desulforhopalus vacuolatus]MBM9520666.1 methylmalonyl-CoA decarboxylase [Desulforhopalus vacuolatus]
MEHDTSEKQEIVTYEEQNSFIGIITMNNPKKLNCLSTELVTGILKAFDHLEESRAHVVILRSYSGCKVWSAGHNIKEIPVDGQDPLNWNVPFERLLHRVRTCPIPVVGMIEGSVWGGACDLAMTCDILVGTTTTTFAITPAKLGLSYNTTGVNHFLGVLPIHIIKEMFFTAQPLSADVAYRLGLLNRLVEPGELESATLKLAGDIASRAPLAVQVLKAEIQRLTAGPGILPDDFEKIQGMRREAYRSEDFKEGIQAFFEKRKPEFKGK